MNLLGGAPSPEILEPLERVFRQALVRGAPRPYGVVVEDRTGKWRTTLANLSLDSRRAAVLVARDGSALSLAARWSVGGALLLPPSTRAMEAALTAARNAATDCSWISDPLILHDLADDPGVLRAAPSPPGVWRALVGERGTVENLAALAKVLGCLPLIDEGPSLLVSGIEANDVRRAWAGMQNRPTWAGPEALEVAVASERGVVPGSAACLPGTWAVAELPSGRPVARWTFANGDPDPVDGRSIRYRDDTGWITRGGDGEPEVIREVVDPQELVEHPTGVARIPGWLTLDLDREGSPGAVLVSALARMAERKGTVLWIPGVTEKSLPLVLRLGGRFWVDGSVVPEP